MLLADRVYDADWIRELAVKKGAWANIPDALRRETTLPSSNSHLSGYGWPRVPGKWGKSGKFTASFFWRSANFRR